MTHAEIARVYENTTAAHEYIVGFKFADMLYFARMGFDKLSNFFYNDRESSKRGGANKIRIRLTSAQRKALVMEAECLGNYNELIEMKDGWNRGEHFERVITEKLTGEKWEKDSKPYYECGDIRVNGIEIQVKLDGAELTNEKAVRKAMAVKAAIA